MAMSKDKKEQQRLGLVICANTILNLGKYGTLIGGIANVVGGKPNPVTLLGLGVVYAMCECSKYVLKKEDYNQSTADIVKKYSSNTLETVADEAE